MKKLKLKALDLGANELLSREQLKAILGGEDGEGCGSSEGGRCYSSTHTCSYDQAGSGTVTGSCSTNSKEQCICSNGTSSVTSEECIK